jgi:hypothetical protein
MQDESTEVTAFFGRNTSGAIKWVYGVLVAIAIPYYIFCLYYCHKHRTAGGKVLVATWVIGPAFWFYFEYVGLLGVYAKKWGLERPRSIEAFKYTQDLGAKVWVAMAAVLISVAGVHI